MLCKKCFKKSKNWRKLHIPESFESNKRANLYMCDCPQPFKIVEEIFFGEIDDKSILRNYYTIPVNTSSRIKIYKINNSTTNIVKTVESL